MFIQGLIYQADLAILIWRSMVNGKIPLLLAPTFRQNWIIFSKGKYFTLNFIGHVNHVFNRLRNSCDFLWNVFAVDVCQGHNTFQKRVSATFQTTISSEVPWQRGSQVWICYGLSSVKEKERFRKVTKSKSMPKMEGKISHFMSGQWTLLAVHIYLILDATERKSPKWVNPKLHIPHNVLP